MIVDNSSSQSADNGEKKGKPFWLKNAGKFPVRSVIFFVILKIGRMHSKLVK